jgi:TRAP-type mannitol/chloroaromatic compound transport system permease small subunit
VLSRSLFSEPLSWGFDVTKQLYALHFMLLGGYALRHGSHVTVDILTERFSSTLRRWVALFGYILFFLPFIYVLTTYSYRMAERSWMSWEKTWGVAEIPVYPIKTVIVIAAVLLLLQGVAEMIRFVRPARVEG